MEETVPVEQVINNSQALINSIIRKYLNYYEYDALYQVGVIGLLKAYNKFDRNIPVKFSTYAYTYILGEVVKYATENRGLKQNKDYRKLGRKIEEARTILTQKLMKVPSSKELSTFLSLPVSLIEDISIANYQLDSLDKTINEDGKELTLMDTLIAPTPYQDDNTIMLMEAIDSLQEPDRSILKMKYLQDYTQETIASKVGLNQVQVSRNLAKSKKILKKVLTTV